MGHGRPEGEYRMRLKLAEGIIVAVNRETSTLVRLGIVSADRKMSVYLDRAEALALATAIREETPGKKT